MIEFKEIITVYTENHIKTINTKCRFTDTKHPVTLSWDLYDMERNNFHIKAV
jgi:hypothetical protein